MGAIGSVLGTGKRPSVRHPEDVEAKFAAMEANGAIKGVHIAATALGLAVATGGNGAGARTATGLAVGDKVFGVVSRGDAGASNLNVTADFEAVITVANQIQQLTTDLTSDLLTVYVIKAV